MKCVSFFGTQNMHTTANVRHPPAQNFNFLSPGKQTMNKTKFLKKIDG